MIDVRRAARFLAFALGVTATIGAGPALAASAAAIDRDVTAALGKLYGTNPEARQLGWQAKAILVFPSIVKAGFLFGAQYGEGALRRQGKTVAYYNTAAASYGLQAGVQDFGYALFFMSAYVVADERDVVRLRTNYRGEEVYVYRLDAPPADARQLLLRYLEAINQLRARPQWYNALTHNCTTSIQALAAPGARRSWWSWKLLLNGYLDELAYEIGALDRSLPFPVLKARSHINAGARAAGDDPRFSVRIREGLPRMSRDDGRADTMRADRGRPGA